MAHSKKYADSTPQHRAPGVADRIQFAGETEGGLSSQAGGTGTRFGRRTVRQRIHSPVLARA
ncbi:hypothetical protein ABZ958_36435 [Streptomyces sp. NPDC046237]|uniref:hypothetical protein n=1 Tax=Streptomyces sp. NPDC046237 TaxID=3154914 RepID=UPI0033E2B865